MSKLCEICGTEIPDGEEFEVDGQVLCHEHFDEIYTICDCCGAVVRIDDTTTVANGDHVCNSCLDREYAHCDDCGEYYPVGDVYFVNDRHWNFVPGRGYVRVGDGMYVCEDCLGSGDYFQCSDCGEWHIIERREMSDDYYDICCDCADNWRVCSECGAVIRESRTYWGDDDEPYCESCYNDRCGAIHEYGYKPYPVFGTTDQYDGRTSYNGEDFTFGVELECDKGRNPRRAAGDIQDLTNRVYCKHDGSLDNGYEVVTMPGTLAWHMNVFPWDRIVEISRDYGFRSHDAKTCGLHIHIGRKQFGANDAKRDAAIARLILLTNAVWPELCHFSRRNGDMHWAHRNEGFDVIRAGMTEARAINRVLDRAYSQGRYLAVNTQNEETVELRFNRGTLELSTIYACLQLANNLAVFAKEHTMDECIEAKWDDVVHCREYDELTTYVNDRFTSYDADAVIRPATSFRTSSAAPATEPVDTTSVEAAYNLLFDSASVFEPVHTEAMPGDVVALSCTPGDCSTERGPRAMAIGTSLNGHTMLYNDHDHDMHSNCRPDLPRRQWMTNPWNYRVVRRLRNNTPVPTREAMLALAERGLTLGDTIVYNGNVGTVAYVNEMTRSAVTDDPFYEVLIHFGPSFDGHNGGMFDDEHSWWIPLRDLSAIDPITND